MFSKWREKKKADTKDDGIIFQTSIQSHNDNSLNDDRDQDRKKAEGIFRTAAAHSISKKVVQKITIDDKEGVVAEAASKILAEYIVRGKSSTKDTLESKSSQPVGTKGGQIHDLLLNFLQSQRTWYLTGEINQVISSTPSNPPAYFHVAPIVSSFIPSSTAFSALHPTFVWVPEIVKKPISLSIISVLPFAQQSLDSTMKSNLEWVLLDQEWRSWVKSSTTGFIEQQSATPKA